MPTNHDPENRSSEILPVPEQSTRGTSENSERRMVLKKLAIGTAALAGCSVLPGKWTSPLVEFGALPAHAVTSGTSEPVADTQGNVREDGSYHGRHNGDRPTWYFSKNMSDYPQTFTVVIEGCSETTVTDNNGERYEEGWVVVKQSDVSGRGMAVVGSPSCGSRSCYIMY